MSSSLPLLATGLLWKRCPRAGGRVEAFCPTQPGRLPSALPYLVCIPPPCDLVFSYGHLWKIYVVLLLAHVATSLTNTCSALSQMAHCSFPKPHAPCCFLFSPFFPLASAVFPCFFTFPVQSLSGV